MSSHPIRLATEDDLPLLGPIEHVAELPPLALSALWSACIDERLWVAERDGVPVGFALLSTSTASWTSTSWTWIHRISAAGSGAFAVGER